VKPSLPPGGVLIVVDHILSIQERKCLTGGYERTSECVPQHIVFVPPASDEQMVPVRCQTCQKEMQFQVDGLKRRKEKRLRAVLLAGSSCLLAVLLEFVIGTFAQAQPKAPRIFYASFAPALLVLYSLFRMIFLFTYPVLHRVSGW